MNLTKAGQGNCASKIMPAAHPWLPEEPDAWSSGELLRLLLVPTIATLFLFGGVCWIRMQRPAGPAARDQASIVRVHLLQRPDPASIPVAAASQPAAASVASRTDASVDDSDQSPVDDMPAVPPARLPAQVEAPTPDIAPTSSAMDAPPSSTTVRFQQALLRHVKRYEHYPKAALRGRLQGSVETRFSMKRDGTVLGVWVKTSSGQAVLDKEAVDTIRRAQPFPSAPPGMPDPVNVDIVLGFDPP